MASLTLDFMMAGEDAGKDLGVAKFNTSQVLVRDRIVRVSARVRVRVRVSSFRTPGRLLGLGSGLGFESGLSFGSGLGFWSGLGFGSGLGFALGLGLALGSCLGLELGWG